MSALAVAAAFLSMHGAQHAIARYERYEGTARATVRVTDCRRWSATRVDCIARTDVEGAIYYTVHVAAQLRRGRITCRQLYGSVRVEGGGYG